MHEQRSLKLVAIRFLGLIIYILQLGIVIVVIVTNPHIRIKDVVIDNEFNGPAQ